MTQEILVVDDEIRYFEDGKLHRLDGPAVIGPDSNVYYVNGLRHRLDGPAWIEVKGYNAYFVSGKLHRIEGPAVYWGEGQEFWLDNVEYSLEEFVSASPYFVDNTQREEFIATWSNQ